ncbi:hypothetical protein BaRGS_00004796 [Batillaria attramentaria]|uniref:Uncharacterized protein n=1 Tax=Batillaria attramentaria TaxID=370345 RepID=A0ABD0LWQ2_9CAEN
MADDSRTGARTPEALFWETNDTRIRKRFIRLAARRRPSSQTQDLLRLKGCWSRCPSGIVCGLAYTERRCSLCDVSDVVGWDVLTVMSQIPSRLMTVGIVWVNGKRSGASSAPSLPRQPRVQELPQKTTEHHNTTTTCRRDRNAVHGRFLAPVGPPRPLTVSTCLGPASTRRVFLSHGKDVHGLGPGERCPVIVVSAVKSASNPYAGKLMDLTVNLRHIPLKLSRQESWAAVLNERFCLVSATLRVSRHSCADWKIQLKVMDSGQVTGFCHR